MSELLREYGVIAVLMVVALSGYFLIGDRRGELMDYTLDMVGSRLIELADGEEEKDRIANQFARFSERVQRDEVSPQMVEIVAANVLNLRARGAVITPEEAELMLFPEAEEGLPQPADTAYAHALYMWSNTDGPEASGDFDIREFNDRLTSLFELADAVDVRGDSAAFQVRFGMDDSGVHVVLDPRLTSGNQPALPADLQKKAWVKWQDNLAEQQARTDALIERQASRLADLETTFVIRHESREAKEVEQWSRIQNLARLGATTNLDTVRLNREINALMKRFSVEIDSIDGRTYRMDIAIDSLGTAVFDN